jgi:imidazolonepropionase-like amidohydrolase
VIAQPTTTHRRNGVCFGWIPPRAREGRWLARQIAGLILSIAVFGGLPVMALAETLVLQGATLIDGTGRNPVPASVVVIEDGRIRFAGAAADFTVPNGARTVDVSGHWITPGLVDAHVHLGLPFEGATLEAQSIRFAFGITTTREAGSLAVARALREKAEASDTRVPRPRLVVAARPVKQNFDAFTPGRTDVNALVAEFKSRGVDAVKLKGEKDVASVVAVVKAARRHGLPVYGHTWGGTHTIPAVFHREAIEAGVNGVAHMGALRLVGIADPAVYRNGAGVGLDRHAMWEWHKELWLKTSRERLDTALREMVQRGVWLEPTLTWEYYFGTVLRYPRQFTFLNPIPSLRQQLAGLLHPPINPTFPEPYARIRFVIHRFFEQGGMLVVGGDEKLPGWDVAKEIGLLRDAGLPAMDAFQCATRNAAMAIGRGETLGTLEPGRLADVVVYRSNPLGPIENMGDIMWVIKGGVMHDPLTVLRSLRERHDRELRQTWLRRGVKLLALLVGFGFALLLAWRARRRWRARRSAGRS